MHEYINIEQMRQYGTTAHPDVYTIYLLRTRVLYIVLVATDELDWWSLNWAERDLLAPRVCVRRSAGLWSGRDWTIWIRLSTHNAYGSFTGNGYEWIIRAKQLLIIIKFGIERHPWSLFQTSGNQCDLWQTSGCSAWLNPHFEISGQRQMACATWLLYFSMEYSRILRVFN